MNLNEAVYKQFTRNPHRDHEAFEVGVQLGLDAKTLMPAIAELLADGKLVQREWKNGKGELPTQVYGLPE